MITFPTTVEAFIADQEERAGCKFNALQRELLDVYVELFNLEFDAGVKGEEPIDILKDTAEFYARKGKLEELEKPVPSFLGNSSGFLCHRSRPSWS